MRKILVARPICLSLSVLGIEHRFSFTPERLYIRNLPSSCELGYGRAAAGNTECFSCNEVQNKISKMFLFCFLLWHLFMFPQLYEELYWVGTDGMTESQEVKIDYFCFEGGEEERCVLWHAVLVFQERMFVSLGFLCLRLCSTAELEDRAEARKWMCHLFWL